MAATVKLGPGAAKVQKEIKLKKKKVKINKLHTPAGPHQHTHQAELCTGSHSPCQKAGR